MIGLLILAIVFYWMLLGGFRRRLGEKIIVSTIIVACFIYYLYSRGATGEQILELLFTF